MQTTVRGGATSPSLLAHLYSFYSQCLMWKQAKKSRFPVLQLHCSCTIVIVDNHQCILLRIKNTLGIQKKVTTESDRCPEAAAGLNQRTVSCLQNRLLTGGPKQETLPPSDILQLLSTTPRYYVLLLLLPITMEDSPTTSTTIIAVTEVVFAFRAKNFEIVPRIVKIV